MPPWQADGDYGGDFLEPAAPDARRARRAAAVGSRWCAGGRIRPRLPTLPQCDRRLAARHARSRRDAARASPCRPTAPTSSGSSSSSSRSMASSSCAAWNSCRATLASSITPTSASIAPTRRGRFDDADPAPGYDGLIANSAIYPDGHFLGWTPAQVPPLLPKGLAWRSSAEYRSGRRTAHAADRQGRRGAADDRFLLRQRSTGADAGDAAAGPPEHRHPAGRGELRHHRLVRHCRSTSRCRRCSRTRTIAPGDGRHRDAARRLGPPADPHPRVGLPLAARLPLRRRRSGSRRARRLPMRYTYDNSAENPRNPVPAAAAGLLGPALGRRDGRPVDSGADAQRAGPADAEPRSSGRR